MDLSFKNPPALAIDWLTITKFNIPNLRVGTLDSLLALNDDLLKWNTFIETASHKIRQIMDKLVNEGILLKARNDSFNITRPGMVYKVVVGLYGLDFGYADKVSILEKFMYAFLNTVVPSFNLFKVYEPNTTMSGISTYHGLRPVTLLILGFLVVY